MILNGLPHLDPASVKFDHSFVFDAHNYNRKQLITRYGLCCHRLAKEHLSFRRLKPRGADPGQYAAG